MYCRNTELLHPALNNSNSFFYVLARHTVKCHPGCEKSNAIQVRAGLYHRIIVQSYTLLPLRSPVAQMVRVPDKISVINTINVYITNLKCLVT